MRKVREEVTRLKNEKEEDSSRGRIEGEVLDALTGVARMRLWEMAVWLRLERQVGTTPTEAFTALLRNFFVSSVKGFERGVT